MLGLTVTRVGPRRRPDRSADGREDPKRGLEVTSRSLGLVQGTGETLSPGKPGSKRTDESVCIRDVDDEETEPNPQGPLSGLDPKLPFLK